MTALNHIVKMIALIRMFGVAPADPTERDDLVSYVAALSRQLFTLAVTQGARATRNALALGRVSIKMLGPTAAAEPLSPGILRMLQSHVELESVSSHKGANCRTSTP